MKLQKDKILTILLTLTAVFFSIIFWNKFHIKYQPNGIIGQYSINNYNSINDPLKYLVLILFPSITFFLCKFFIEKKKLKNFYLFFLNKQKLENINNKTLNLFFSIFLILLIIEFFSLDFSYHKLDIFHSGQKLNSAFKSFIDNSLWSGSYVTSGVFIEIINTKFIWKLFDFQSIGLFRFLETTLILTTKILLLFLSLKISKINEFNQNLRLFYFITLAFILINLIDYDINSADLIESREIFNLILLILIINFICSYKKRLNFSLILFGALSALSFLWSIDRAIIYNLITICVLFYFAINKDYKSIMYTIIIIMISWLIIFSILDDEFVFFKSNTISILSEISDVHGIIHPNLFSDQTNSSRATKTVFVILFSLLFAINISLKNNFKNKDSKINIFLVVLSIFSFLSYIYALGRSDGGHIKQAFGYPSLFLIVLILSIFFKFLNKVYFNKKIKFLKLYVFIFTIILSAYLMNFNFNNLKNYYANFTNYIYSKDKEFLNQVDYNFILESSKILKNENCIDLYTYDSPLLYLLKKPSCSRFSFLWSIGSEKNQKEFIESLKKSNAIITNGKTDHWGQIPFIIKYPILDKYIKENFKHEINIGERKIKFRN